MTVSKKYNDNLVAGGAVRDGNGKRIDTTYAKNANLASVATSGSYNDLTNKPVVDQTYDGTSANAQSGIAVEQAINTVKRNIGEVVTSTIPLTDAGLHLLDGSLISGSGVYAEFVEYIASIYDASANYFCTESDWQNSVTTYGVCGKFVYDSVNNTVRLPKITGFTEGTTDVNTLGDLTEAGLPNITGTVAGIWDGSRSGAFNNVTHSGDLFDRDSGGGKGNWGTASFSAQSSNSIYGNSITVQPQSVKILYYMVVANKTKTDIQVDIDNIATDLNNALNQYKYDGQWVLNGITANTSTALGTYTIDLSSYLPNDGYTYEIICNTRISRGDTSTSGGTNTNYRIQDDLQTITWSQIEADYSNFQQANDSFIVIVGRERALKLVITGLKCDGAYTRFMAYRRIGTNS